MSIHYFLAQFLFFSNFLPPFWLPVCPKSNDKGIKYFEEAGEIRNELRDFAGLSSIYFDISIFHYLNNNLEQAHNYVLKGLELFDHLTSESQIELFASNAYQLFRQADLLDVAHHQFKALRKRILRHKAASPEALIQVYKILGQIYLELSKIKAATWCFNCLIELVAQYWSTQKAVGYLGWVGKLFEETERFAQALVWYSRAVEIASRESLKNSEAGMRYNTGNIYARLERFDEAETSYQEALKIAEQIDDLKLQDLILHNLGFIERVQGRFENAISLFSRSLDITKRQNDTYHQVTTLNNLGLTYNDAGQLQDAISCFEEGIAICRISSHRSQESDILIGLGNLYCNLNQFDQSEPYYQESLRIAQESEDWERQENAVLSLGHLYYRQGKFTQIEELFLETAQKTGDLGRYAQLTDFLIIAGDVAIDTGDLEDAVQNLVQSLLAAFYAGVRRLVDNASLESPTYLREYNEVWSRILIAIRSLIDEGQRDKAKEFCEHLLDAIVNDQNLDKWTRSSIQPQLKAIKSYLEDDNDQPFVDFLASLNFED